MDTRTRDIRFACSHCGQRIVVDASAGGAEVECPMCTNPVRIPLVDGFADVQEVTAAAGRRAASPARTSPPGMNARVEPLEHEVRELRGEVARLEHELRASEEHRRQLGEVMRALKGSQQQAADDLELARERIKALEAEASAMQERRTGAEKELKEARAEIVRLQDESALHRRSFDEAQPKIAAGEAAAKRVEELAAELRTTRAKLESALDETINLHQHCDELQAQAERARRELLQTESGRALEGLRAQLAENEAERKRLALQLADTRADLQRVTKSEAEWRSQFDLMRSQRDEAVRHAEEGSTSALNHGNDILRGIIDRQKLELDERYAELRRLRAAQLSVRLFWAVAAVLFLAAIALGLRALATVY